MKKMYRGLSLGVLLAFWCQAAGAQTADEVIEKHLAAAGGRAAIGKLTSRTSVGTITLGSPVGDLTGSIETDAKAPNKTRTVIKLDLSAVGGGQVLSDQRFDGSTGYVIDTFNGNREITGAQLEAMKNGFFPTPLLSYKEYGIQMTLGGREPVIGKDAYVVVMTPKTGPAAKLFIDAETMMLVRTAMTLNVPQLGGDVEQVVDFSDFREVDGVKVPFVTKATNPAQAITATLKSVIHNAAIDDSSFVRPPQ